MVQGHWVVDMSQQSLLSWLPVFSVASAALAWIAVLYVRRMAQQQLKVTTDQRVVVENQLKAMQEQASIVARLEQLEARQAETLSRQTEVAGLQQQIVREQQGRHVVLAFKLVLQMDGKRPSWRVFITNTGNLTSVECAWCICTPEDLGQMVRVQKSDGSYIRPAEDRPDILGTAYRPHYGEIKRSIFPNTDLHVATIVIHPQVVSNARVFFPIPVKYSITSEEGTFPKNGYLDLMLEDAGVEWGDSPQYRH